MQKQTFLLLFSSPVRKYRKSYCSHPGITVSVGIALMLKFLVKVFISLYLLNMWKDYVDTLHGGRYWSEVLFCTIMTHASDLEGHGLRNFVLKFLVKVFVSLYLLNVLMDQVYNLYIDRCLKFYAVPSRST